MKYRRIILVLLLMLFPINCFASTNTLTRTKENLLVPDKVTVTDNNIDNIMKTPAVSSTEKIYDYADLYTDDEEKKLFEKVNNFINNSKVDAAIITTKDLGGFSIREYANNFYDYNSFEKNGVVFVIYVTSSSPEIYMGNSGSKTSEVFSIYTDKRINSILKYLYPDIKSGSYYTATDNYIKIIDGFYSLSHSGNYRLNEQGVIVKSIPWLELVVLATAVTAITIILLSYKLKVKFTNEGKLLDSNIVENTMMVKLVKDEPVQSVSSEKINL